MKTVATIIIIVLFLGSCRTNTNVDKTKVGKIKTVLVLGNSILRHPPKEDIGWSGDWGMAATVRDSDFLHILIKDIHAKDPSVKVNSLNIANFEKGFATFQYSKLDSFINPDMIIIKVAENVDTLNTVENDFIAHYDKLLKYLDQKNKAVKIILDGFWWRRLNTKIKDYALKNKYPFISITDISFDSSNMAAKDFSNPGIAVHPSNKGMRLIAERIWNYVGKYY